MTMGFVGILAMLTILALSLIITRVATVALTMTGLSREAARFQARSAFTGTGFTTSESEAVVSHPVRRQIIMLLMVIRSAGLVSVILSLILSFLGSASEADKLLRLGLLAAGVGILWAIARSQRIEHVMSLAIQWALARWTHLDVRDYSSLLRLSGNYSISEQRIEEGDWLADKRLRECALLDEGVIVLGISRNDGTYVGGPTGNTEILAGDTLILYGRAEKLDELDRRRADSRGDRAHHSSVAEEREHAADERRRDDQHVRERRAACEEQAAAQGEGR